MKGKIKILIVIFAYMLNFAHDFQPHEHSVDGQIYFVNKFSIFQHHHDESESDHHHHEHNNSDNSNSEDRNLPFNHHHINQSHDKYQIRYTVNNIQVLKFSWLVENDYIFKSTNRISKDIIIFDIIQLFRSIIGANACLRAPPVI